MKVIAYKMFESSEQFEEWQVENPEVGIINVSPFVGNVSGKQRGSDTQADFNLNVPINAFITYFKEV